MRVLGTEAVLRRNFGSNWGPSEGGVEPERELPPEASVTVCSVGQSKFNSSVGVCYV